MFGNNYIYYNTAIVEHWHFHEILQTLLSIMQISMTIFVVIIKNRRCEFSKLNSLVISQIMFALFIHFFFRNFKKQSMSMNIN